MGVGVGVFRGVEVGVVVVTEVGVGTSGVGEGVVSAEGAETGF